MDEVFQRCLDLWRQFAADPTSQTHALLGAILLLMVFRRRRQRSTIDIDVPPGEYVGLEVGKRPADRHVIIPPVVAGRNNGNVVLHRRED